MGSLPQLSAVNRSLEKRIKTYQIKMDQIVANATTIINHAEEYSVPATKIAIPLAALYLGSKALGTVWRRFIGPLLLGEVKWREMGSWAVIAGASYGIGGEYAKELAKRGMNVFIIGHDEAGLKNVEMAIKQQTSVQVRRFVADFSNGMVGFDAVKEAIKDLDIGVLVNTAALDLPFGSFDGCDAAAMKKLIDVTCGTPTVYPSTKTFCHKLTRDLQVWYKDSGVIFQTVMPGVVGSPMAYNLPNTLLIPNPENYTRSLIKTVGWVDETAGYIPHDLQFATMKALNWMFGDYSMIKYWPYHSKPQLTAKKTN